MHKVWVLGVGPQALMEVGVGERFLFLRFVHVPLGRSLYLNKSEGMPCDLKRDLRDSGPQSVQNPRRMSPPSTRCKGWARFVRPPNVSFMCIH